MNYKRTHVKVVVKIFSDYQAAVQEAQVFWHARGNPESASRLPQLVGMLQDKTNSYILLEHIEGGDLFQRIHSMEGANVPGPLALHWMLELLQCVQGLHRRNIAHMDLSPEVCDSPDRCLFVHEVKNRLYFLFNRWLLVCCSSFLILVPIVWLFKFYYLKQNILLDRNGRCLLIDFEMSIILPASYRKGTLYQGIPCCGKGKHPFLHIQLPSKHDSNGYILHFFGCPSTFLQMKNHT